MKKINYSYMQRDYESIEDIFKDMYDLEMGLEFLSENIYPVDMKIDRNNIIKFPFKEFIKYRYKKDLEKYCGE